MNGWAVALLSAGLLALFGPWSVESGDAEDNKTDFAFFDGTNPATGPPFGGSECAVKGPATLHASVTADSSGPSGFVRLTYQDNDFVQFPIASNGVLQLAQAIGGAKRVSSRGRVCNTGGPGVAPLARSPSVLGLV